jgi:uncharacterized protein YbjT (DUF2867 family)
MTILVTGATGNVGRQVVEQLVKRGADVRALVRDPAKANFPASVNVVKGDLLDVDSLRSAFSGVSTLFLLNAVVAEEFTQALTALNLAREAGIERIVYLSVNSLNVHRSRTPTLDFYLRPPCSPSTSIQREAGVSPHFGCRC